MIKLNIKHLLLIKDKDIKNYCWSSWEITSQKFAPIVYTVSFDMIFFFFKASITFQMKLIIQYWTCSLLLFSFIIISSLKKFVKLIFLVVTIPILTPLPFKWKESTPTTINFFLFIILWCIVLYDRPPNLAFIYYNILKKCL